MTNAAQALRLLSKIAELGAEGRDDERTATPDGPQEARCAISESAMLAALAETDFDLHATIVRLDRDA